MIARLIELCARNRAIVFLVTAVATIAAVQAIRTTPIDALPDLSDPQVIVTTEWMGRSPTIIEDQLGFPISTALLSTPHVTAVRGFSMPGMAFHYVLFEEGTDPDWARARVLEQLSRLGGQLPAGVTPQLGPDATGVGWIFQYALVDEEGRHDPAELRTWHDTVLRPTLAATDGVAEIAGFGGFQREFQITVDPIRLQGYGIALQEVADAVRRSNRDAGGRVLELSGREHYVRSRGSLTGLQDLERVAVKVPPGGTPVLLRDVATVAFGPAERRGAADLDGRGEVVSGVVVMRQGENARAVIARVKEKLAQLQQSAPAGVKLRTTYDRAELIERAIGTLREALLEESIVVALVVLIFLLHLRSSLVALITLPIAVALAFLPMKLLGIGSDVMSLGGIAIAIGELVDAAIVLVENAHKRLEREPAALSAAARTKVLIEAAQEVGPAIFAALLIVTVSFLPVFALQGQAGRLFGPLAFTKSFAMLAGAILSVTLGPALLVTLVKGKIRREEEHPVSRALVAAYRPFVTIALKNPRTTAAIGLFAILSALPLLPHLGSEFMPELDEGDRLFMPTTLPGVSIEEQKRALQAQDRLLAAFPEVASVHGKAGRAESATDPAPLSMIETVIRLHPKERWRMVEAPRFWQSFPAPLHPPLRALFPDRRRITAEELTAKLNEAVALPGFTAAMSFPIQTRIDMLTSGVRTPVGVKVLGPELAGIERTGAQLEALLAAVPGVRSAFFERTEGGLYVDVIPDREALARYGLSIEDVNAVVEGAIGGERITTVIDGRARYGVTLRYPRDLRDDLDRLREVLVPLRAAGGGMGEQGALDRGALRGALAQGMSGMEEGSPAGGASPGGASVPGGLGRPGTSHGPSLGVPARLDVGSSSGLPLPPAAGLPLEGRAQAAEAPTQVPLGQLAEVKIVEGPPMLRSEDGQLAGIVYVDVDTARGSLGEIVERAQATVAQAQAEGRLVLAPGAPPLQWTGRYEELQRTSARLRWLIPLSLALIVLFLWLELRSWVPVLLVLLSVPFALVGSVWLMFLLGHHLSTAVAVGMIALVGLAASTGVVMLVYLEQVWARRVADGTMRTEADLLEAVLEGTVLRVRPKLMTVATTLLGLLPLLWADGTGSEVMKRLAAPVVGGLFTSAFLTLEIIPVLYLAWRRRHLPAASPTSPSAA